MSGKENPVSLVGPEPLWLEARASQLLPEWGRKVPWGTGLSQLLSLQATPTCCYHWQGPGFATPGDLPVLHSPETKGGAWWNTVPTCLHHTWISSVLPVPGQTLIPSPCHPSPFILHSPCRGRDTPSLVQTEDSSTPALPWQ